MGNHRMFSKGVTESDKFLDMPLSAQALYMHLGLNADDDGFVNNPKKIQRMVGAADDDLKILFAKGFVINFETGIVVITHWKQQNAIRKDRYKGTLYREELAMLSCNDVGDYALNGIPTDNQLTTNCEILATNWQPSDNQAGTKNADLTTDGCHKVRQGKARQDKVIQGKVSEDTILSGKPDDAQVLSPAEVKARAVADTAIPYLNELTGMHYKTRTAKTIECIQARVNEGFTEADFRTVIWKMVREWKGTEYEKFLRPETLFSNKFEGYLNRPDTTQEEYEHNKSMKKYSRIYEWAMREEEQANEQDGVFQYGDTDQSDLPDFSSNG